jgi:hypothetical protein
VLSLQTSSFAVKKLEREAHDKFSPCIVLGALSCHAVLNELDGLQHAGDKRAEMNARKVKHSLEQKRSQ